MWVYRHLLEVDENTTASIINGNMDFWFKLNVIDSGFPPDLFTFEQLRNGAIILHIIGIYANHQNIPKCLLLFLQDVYESKVGFLWLKIYLDFFLRIIFHHKKHPNNVHILKK